MRRSILAALLAALLFGLSTPLAKRLLGELAPVLLAGLLYLGSGLGLWIWQLLRARRLVVPALSTAQWRVLAAAVLFGGVLGPGLLMWGLVRTSAADASLLLNLEAVMTALLAWLVFRESTDARIVVGMLLIVAGGVLLAWQSSVGGSSLAGAAAVAAACLCWALDNNLTRKLADADAVFLAGSKGLVAGLSNLGLALALGARLPDWPLTLAAMLLGLAGYGLSLVLFVLALRGLGAARTGAYFATAPFIGATVAVFVFGEPASATFWLAAALMAAGVFLHLSERHEHAHVHEPLLHTHAHRHDAHHQHPHDFPWDGREPHTHAHRHEALQHRHPHYPDAHHRHRHPH